MSGLAANRSPQMVAPRSPRITYSGFYKGGRGARFDSKAGDWNYGHRMFDLAVRDPGCTGIGFKLGKAPSYSYKGRFI